MQIINTQQLTEGRPFRRLFLFGTIYAVSLHNPTQNGMNLNKFSIIAVIAALVFQTAVQAGNRKNYPIRDSHALETVARLGLDTAKLAIAQFLEFEDTRYIFAAPEPDMEKRELTLTVFTESGGEWAVKQQLTEPLYWQRPHLDTSVFNDSIAAITINGKNYIHFRYTTTGTAPLIDRGVENIEFERVTNLYNIADNTLFSSLFYGDRYQGKLYGTRMDEQVSFTEDLIEEEQILYCSDGIIMDNYHSVFNPTHLIYCVEQWHYYNRGNKSDRISSVPLYPHESDTIVCKAKRKIHTRDYTVTLVKDIFGNNIITGYRNSDTNPNDIGYYRIFFCNFPPACSNLTLNKITRSKKDYIKLKFKKGNGIGSITKKIDIYEYPCEEEEYE